MVHAIYISIRLGTLHFSPYAVSFRSVSFHYIILYLSIIPAIYGGFSSFARYLLRNQSFYLHQHILNAIRFRRHIILGDKLSAFIHSFINIHLPPKQPSKTTNRTRNKTKTPPKAQEEKRRSNSPSQHPNSSKPDPTSHSPSPR